MIYDTGAQMTLMHVNFLKRLSIPGIEERIRLKKYTTNTLQGVTGSDDAKIFDKTTSHVLVSQNPGGDRQGLCWHRIAALRQVDKRVFFMSQRTQITVIFICFVFTAVYPCVNVPDQCSCSLMMVGLGSARFGPYAYAYGPDGR